METIEIYWNQRLGGGGEGEVFKGRFMGALVAVKVPHHHNLIRQDPVLRAYGREGLEREWQRRILVNGQHHVKILGHGLDNLVPCLVYELAEGGSLADEMEEMKRRGQTYEPLAALGRIEEILCALREAHESNVIHRDVKPSNFLKFACGHIKLNDFGLGRTADRACSDQTRFQAGTPLYMAPEQRAGQCVTKRADLYAVGLILHEMLFGTLPDPSTHPSAIPLRANIGFEMRSFVSKLLARDPSTRYCCAPRALADLANVRGAYQGKAQPCPRCGQIHR